MAASAVKPLTAEMLADLELPHEVELSPSADQVVYTLRSDWNRPRGRWVSSLWIAEVGKQHSASQLTNGESNDSWPQFSPDGKSIAFLSDRAHEGITAIWLLSVGWGEAVPLTSTVCEQSVAKFAWSGDGKRIAYLSADEKTAELKAKIERGDDAIVHGQSWDYARLRTIELANRSVDTPASEDCHVYGFAWSPDSKSIAYATQRTTEGSSANVHGTSLEMVRLDSKHKFKLSHFPGPLEDLCWCAEHLWFRAKCEPKSFFSSKALNKMSFATGTCSWHAYGKKDCASTWALPPGLRKVDDHNLVVQVQSGLADQIHTVPDGTVLYNELHEVKSFAVRFKDGEFKDGNAILAVVKSSASKPLEVYSIVDGEIVCLSEHGKEVAEVNVATAEPFYATAQDGTALDGVLVVPSREDLVTNRPWPTIVLVHGGPYLRVSCGFDIPNFNWSPWLASRGYALLCVNYRGNSSHGESYAAGMREAGGTTDYSDMIDLVKAGVAKGLIDKDRVGIAGWSYGGYLSFLAVTRDSEFHFQAAMCGAGLSDWDLAISTDPEPLQIAECAGHAPWHGDQTDISNRQGSPLWHMQNIKTPILIIHGENDDAVSVNHSRAFHHGCQFRDLACDLVIYPREMHGFFPPFERAHYLDMLERMQRFFGKHLGVDRG